MKVRLNAEALRLMLVRRNLSQNELARRMRISSGHMSLLMRGMRSPSPKVRRRLLRSLRVESFDDLFTVEYGKTNGKRANEP